MKDRTLGWIGTDLVVAMLGAGCSQTMASSPAMSSASTATSSTKAAALRAGLDYTIGVASGDGAKRDRAVNDLIAYTQDFGAFLSSANPNLPKPVVAELVKHHVVTLKEVIDAQATKDPVKAYQALSAAVQ